MKIISSRVHGYLDYATVLFLLAAPSLFHMEGPLRTFTYSLAAVHFVLTALTAFEVGLVKVIPFRLHGLIEFAVAIVLAGVAFWFRSNNNDLGFYFYMALAIVIVVVFLLTDFKQAPKQITRTAI